MQERSLRQHETLSWEMHVTYLSKNKQLSRPVIVQSLLRDCQRCSGGRSFPLTQDVQRWLQIA